MDREPRVCPVVERPLEHHERDRDAAVEARLTPDPCPSAAPSAYNVAATPHTTRGSGSI